MIIYLDFDGVLHDEDVIFTRKSGIQMRTPGRTLFEWMPILEELLAPHPDVKIVLSTSWVRVTSFNRALYRLSEPLRERVIGATYHKGLMDTHSFSQMPRGLQIWGDVLRRKPDDWFAIDDDYFGWPTWCRDKLIQTDDRLGISDPAIQAAIRERLQGA